MVDTFYQVSDKLPQYNSLFETNFQTLQELKILFSRSVIPQLFLQCESKRKYDTLPVRFTCLNMPIASLHKNIILPEVLFAFWKD